MRRGSRLTAGGIRGPRRPHNIPEANCGARWELLHSRRVRPRRGIGAFSLCRPGRASYRSAYTGVSHMEKILQYLAQAVLVVVLSLIAFQIVRRWFRASSKVGTPTLGQDVLFSLPTICDPTPPLAETPHQPAEGEVVLQEDDWRQIEFVSGENQDYIEEQFVQQRRFRAEKRQSAGYTAILPRPEHPVQFSRLGVSQAALRDALGISSWQSLSVDWLGGAREVEGGFAASLGHGVVLYGHAIDDVVQQLGLLVPSHDLSISCPEPVQRVGRFVKADLVDWYRLARIARSDTPGFCKWWDTNGS
jgi:hypothetical protein